MKLHVISDLHMDDEHWSPPAVLADACVIAGDLFDDGERSIRWCGELAQRTGMPIVLVPGNHDFYDAVVSTRLREMHRMARNYGVHLLHNRDVVIGDVRFIGATLWSDFEVDGRIFSKLAKHAANDLMGDFRRIRTRTPDGGAQPLSPDYAIRMHRRARRAIERGLEDAYSEKVVVVTHHAPTLRSLDPAFRYSPLNGAYVTQMDDFVASSMARVWIHGHLHRNHDFTLGSTRVLCNPRGSGRHLNVEFNPAFVVEV